jgi:putative NADH-flavin reductase
MNLAIFGATGKTGKLIVERALAAGHHVNALVRDPAKVSVSHPLLTVIPGAADQAVAIEQTVRGVDVVISAMGGGNATLTTFGRNVASTMTRTGVTRIVSLVGASVSEPSDPASLSHGMLRGMTRLLAASTLEDGERHARELEASSLAYTLVRPPRLTDGPATGRIRHGLALSLGPWSSISRADLATFMLGTALGDQYRRAAPMVASSRR